MKKNIRKIGEKVLSRTYIICFSGGLSSALCAIETVKRYGKENCILLNHDISSKVEDASVKRFKQEVALALGMEITYANAENFEDRTPIAIALEKGGFAFQRGKEICTYELKTKPFYDWLKKNFPVEKGKIREDVVIVYGFGKQEKERIRRRREILAQKGYLTAFPLKEWKRTITDVSEIGVREPEVYHTFLHANCVGCLKAGMRSWYVTYCLRKDIFNEAMEAEEKLGYSILKKCFLKDLVPLFKNMQEIGMKPTDRGTAHAFWKEAHAIVSGQLSVFSYCSIN